MQKRPTTQQRAVIAHRDGPAVVVAGAGTGKTHTICERVASLVAEGTPPEDIMMLTFTNAAAEEMCSRIAEKIGHEAASRIQAGTFHAIAAKMLRTYGWTRDFTDEDDHAHTVTTTGFRIMSALDNVDNIALVRERYDDEMRHDRLADIDFPPAAKIAEILSDWENRNVDSLAQVMRFAKHQRYASALVMSHLESFARYYDNYKRANDLMSFDDLIEEWIALIAMKPRTCQAIRHMIVDEAQDINGKQYELLDAIAENMCPQNVMLVGDAAQSIYGWRGSDVHLFDTFARDYQATVYELSHNFRSQPEILDVANTVLVGADIALTTKLVPGRTDLDRHRHPITCQMRTPHYDIDARQITLDEISTKGRAESVACVARTANELRVVEQALIERDIPYEMHGGPKFNELACVRDTMSMLQMAFREATVSAAECARVMTNYDQVGNKTASKIARTPFPRCLKEHGFETARGLRAQAVHDMCQDLITAKLQTYRAGWPDAVREAADWYLRMYGKQRALAIRHDRSRRPVEELEAELKEQLRTASENLDMLCDIAYKEASLTSFVDRMALESPNVQDEPATVILSTIHSAKGLEWDRVIVLDVVDDVFPGKPRETDQHLAHEEMEEQRRCLYVAVTRARDRLVLCAPDSIMLAGNRMITTPCRYL